jgi:hypothetical protein
MSTQDIHADASEASAVPHPFVAEVLVSAGPRKSPGEYRDDPTNEELCEDCGGLCWVGERLIFWLCDGGSNARILPRLPAAEVSEEAPPIGGFSARVLAQDLGQAFVEYLSDVLQQGQEIGEIDLTKGVFSPVARAWEERLHDHIAYYEARSIPIIETLPKLYRQDRVLRRLDWTSTFTGGVFLPQEHQINLINYGASGGLVMAKSPAIIEPNMYHIGVVAIVQSDEALHIKLRIAVNETVRWARYSEVNGFALISDGLKQDGSLLKRLEALQGEAFRSLKEVRNALLREAYLTEDDKAIVFGRFL